jgi:hypothetical protein
MKLAEARAMPPGILRQRTPCLLRHLCRYGRGQGRGEQGVEARRGAEAIAVWKRKKERYAPERGSLNLSYFVARDIWRSHSVCPPLGRTHRLQRRKSLRYLSGSCPRFRPSTNCYKLSIKNFNRFGFSRPRWGRLYARRVAYPQGRA